MKLTVHINKFIFSEHECILLIAQVTEYTVYFSM